MQQPTAVPASETLQIRFPLCAVAAPVQELAAMFRAPVQEWVEPGLGPAVGFACKLRTGLPLFLEHLLLAPGPTGVGPIIYVEAATLVQRGVPSLLAEVMSELHLASGSETWHQTGEGVQAAEELVQIWADRQRGKNDA